MLELAHPFYDRKVPIVVGEHVTLEAGTGLVHTAPAHGLDDYVVGSRYNLPVDNPVDDDGRFFASVPLVGGLSVWDANKVVIETLEQEGRLLKQRNHHAQLSALLAAQDADHLSRHARSGSSAWIPTITPAAAPLLREVAQKAVAQTEFFPGWGRARLDAMIAQSSRLVRFAAAQLGHADGAVRAQGDRRVAPAHRSS